ncbi:MAG: DUF4258 domain-containing protein [Bryobacteraceae bacterium]
MAVVTQGETIVVYAGDVPYPSRLLLGFVDSKPLHVVVAIDRARATCIVVTAYEPAVEQWGTDFRTRKKQ